MMGTYPWHCLPISLQREAMLKRAVNGIICFSESVSGRPEGMLRQMMTKENLTEQVQSGKEGLQLVNANFTTVHHKMD